MWIYFFVFVVVCFFALLSATFRKPYVKGLCCGAAALALILFGGLRWEMWTDWWQYQYLFDNIYITKKDFEIGYIWVNTVLFFIGFDYTGFLVLFYLSLLSLLIQCAKYYSRDMYALSLIVYCSLFFLTSGGTRQHIALFFFLLSIRYIIDKQFWRFLILLVVASLFHRTILIMFPLYWINKLKLNKWVLFAGLGVSLLLTRFNIMNSAISFVLQHVINDGGSFIRRIVLYFNGGTEGVSVGLGFVRKALVLLLCYMVYSRKNHKSFGLYIIQQDEVYYDKLVVLIKIYFVGVVLSMVIYGIFGRLLTYLFFVECLLIPMIVKSVKSRYMLVFVLMILSIYSLGYIQSLGVFGRNSLTTTDSLFFPYKSVFD